MKISFWISLFVVLYVYIGYPLTLFLLTGRRSRPTKRDKHFFPTVSLIIAAYNEEKILQEKLENSLALAYPKSQLEIVVASDGSTDATNTIARAYADRGVVLHEITPRGGKTRALNLVIPKTKGEILVLSDANTMYRPEAIQKLVQHFADPTVGAVSGDVQLFNAADSHARSEGLYYQYERWLQRMESKLGSIIGADGGMYAVARHCFRAPSPDIIIDDFVISMNVARLGYRVLYELEAIAIEQGTFSSWEEFRRKVRIVAGGIQALKRGEGLPRLTQPLLLLCYVSHKVLRWLVPWFLAVFFVSSGTLTAHFPYNFVFSIQVLFYGIAILYARNSWEFRQIKWSGIPFYFCLVNIAAFIGFWRGLLGTQKVTWKRTSR